MVFRRRGAKRAAARKRRSNWKGKFRRARAMYGQRTFTEMLEASAVTVNSGGIWQCKFTDLPQAAQYSNLYKQFCIKKLQVILLPDFTSADASTLLSGTQMPRLAFAIDDTPNVNAPANELDVLTSNGSKVIVAGNKAVITCYPKPNIAPLVGAYGAYVATRTRGPVWLNTDAAEVAFSGTGLPHGGIRYWLSGAPLSPPYVQYSVYYKITFALRDPA